MRGCDPPDLAAWQGGVFTARQAIEAGFSPSQVRYRVNTGRWHRVLGQTLSAASRPRTGWEPLALGYAAVLTWPGAIVGFHVAGALLGFPIASHQISERVHVFLRTQQRPRPGLIVHRHGLQPNQVVHLGNGLTVTDDFRTALDCLGTMSPPEADALYSWLTTRRRLTHADLGAGVRYFCGHPGAGALRRLQARTSSGAVSEAERRTQKILRDAGINGWIAGAQISDTEGVIGVVDLLFPAARVVVEIDGRRAHSEKQQFERDRQRQNRLVLAGYLVLRYTWEQITANPARMVAEIRQTLHDRELG